MRSAGSRFVHPPVRPWIITGALALVAGIPGTAHPRVLQREFDTTRAQSFEYVSPVPGSSLISPRNNIVFRQGSAIDEGSLASAVLSVTGASSGAHGGRLVLSDDSKTIVFTPDLPFAPGEEVEVAFEGGIRSRAGDDLPALDFRFTVAGADPAGPPLETGLSDEFPPDLPLETGPPESALQPPATAACGPLPPSYPPIALRLSDQPEPGYVFLTPFRTFPPGHLVIVDNLGIPIFYRRIPLPSTDFKVQPDGRLTYFSQGPGAGTPKFYALDASYTVVDSFAAGNGYRADSHDLQVLANGHALLLSYDPEPVRMDLLVPGGKANATVIGLILQEIDAAKNVVFQWRSWDHFQITDATSPLAGLTSLLVDYVHGNSIELDHDGNLLLSSRHLCEITKIDRQTGEILWRMGPHASQNQFTFVNDPRGFSHQHDVRRLPNGHITVFDNGNLDSPEYSRALEYEVDEDAKRATLVWQFRNQPDTYGSFMGSVQRYAGGGTLIGWGGTQAPPAVTELHADGTKAFELGMAGGTWSYRALRFPWRTNRFVTDVTALDFGDVRVGDSRSLAVRVRNPSADAITINCAFSTDPAFEVAAPLPSTLDPGGAMEVEVRYRPALVGHSSAKLYVRSTTTTQLIAQDVDLAGSGVTNRPPDCGLAHATPAELWPPEHQLVPVAIEGVTDPDGDPVTIEITAITQDEDFQGAGVSACPSAVLEDGTAWLRAERDGNGNGRVYRIAFTARDPAGASCEGTVRVCVPHDQGLAGAPASAACVEEEIAVSALGPCLESRRPPALDAAAPAGPGFRAGRTGGGNVAIEFTPPADGDVTLAFYDVAGRRVATLESAVRGAGPQRVVWNTAGIPAGMYFCRVRAGSATILRPILVVK